MATTANKFNSTEHFISTTMTIRERPSSKSLNNSDSNSAFFGTFRRSFGFGDVTENLSNIPNCVFANWPEALQQINENCQKDEETRRMFVTLKPISNATSAENKENEKQKTIHLQLKYDHSVERRILSIPAHILRWIGFELGDEVTVQMNNDLNRGFMEMKENLPTISCTISRLQIQIELTELRELSKLTLCADTLSDCFRQTFLHDVLNAGQCCLMEFECATKNFVKQGNDGGRKRKYVEMKEQKVENDFKPPQPKKGLAASAMGALFGWTRFDVGDGINTVKIPQKFTFKAKILALYRSQPESINSDCEAQFGIVKKSTQILLCPIAESGLCLYGDPAIICSSKPVSANTVNQKPNATIEANKNDQKQQQPSQAKVTKPILNTTNSTNTAAGVEKTNNNLNNNADKNVVNNTNNANEKTVTNSIKLSVQQFEGKMRSTLTNDNSFLIHQQDYNVVTNKFAETPVNNVTPITNSYTQKSKILISYKIQEETTNKEASNIKERQFVWTAVNQTDYGLKGERGKIFFSQEIMDALKIEYGDELTIQSFNDAEQKTANLIKIEINRCDGSSKCPIIKNYLGTHSKSTFFHAKDIVNSFRRANSGKVMNLNITEYLNVQDDEIKNRMKNFKTNLFDQEANNTLACVKFRIIEIQGNTEKDHQSSITNTTESASTSTQNAEKNIKMENIQFAAIKKDTVIEIKCIDSNLTIFGLEDQSIAPTKLFDENGWNLHKKIGGMDEQLDEIFRRAFASRMISADCSKQMDVKHIRGILLHGPPGTGKTLIARELAKALNAREPKIINGAEVQSMWFGQSEKNVRSLFVDAEREQALAGDESRLHVIIIDELDALCPNRQNIMSGHRTEQRIVNTLLAKLDGVEQLNNILLIGMTNLLETIDPALLRPGRMELKIHIGLPNAKGRHEILEIHTKTMRETNRLNEDVNLEELAEKTVNFSGAELEGLVRAAQSQAIQRILKAKEEKKDNQQNGENTKDLTSISISNDSELKICSADFEMALENDIEPAFGKGSMDGTQLKAILCREPILWSAKIEKLLEKGAALVEELRNSDVSTFGQCRLMLLNGPRQSGKTFLATTIAQIAKIHYIRFVTADLILSEKSPISLFDKILSDCEHTDFACIIFDELEQIIGYNESNQSYQQIILQKLAIILNREPPKGKRLLLLATSSAKPEWFEQMQLEMCLQNRVELPIITKLEDIIQLFGAATKKTKTSTEIDEGGKMSEKLFTKCELDEIAKEIGLELSLADNNAKLIPTIKDLVKLIDWYIQQSLDAKNSLEGEQSNENNDGKKSTTNFEKIKQRLLQLIAQKRGSNSNNSMAHLSMYR